jgi:hypothetical protein
MTAPLRITDMTHAEPLRMVAGHGRLPETIAAINKRDGLIREAARRFYVGMSDREAARRLRSALTVYAAGRWRRDCSEAACPIQHRGKLIEILYRMLRVRDHVPSDPTFRRALGSRDPAGRVQSSI